MRTWTRVAMRSTLCGRCGRDLVQGDPVLCIAIGGGRALRRCEQCEGPAPPDLPAFIERTHAIPPLPLRRLVPAVPRGPRLVDWRARAAGEREPGEEG
jgi:hypothetical protein